MSNLIIRAATADDLAFIRASWMASYWKSGFAPRVTQRVFVEGYGKKMARLLQVSSVQVACFESVPEEVLGYSVLEGDTGHWVYVKAPYRRQHIGSALVRGMKWHTTDTRHGRLLAAKVESQFNPWR